MGLGATVAYTPAGTGKVLVVFSAMVETTGGLAALTVGPRYGTGTAPTNGAANTGTLFGPVADFSTRGTGTGQPTQVTANTILALTPGTAYWFDFALATGNTSDPAVMTNVQAVFVELPY